MSTRSRCARKKPSWARVRRGRPLDPVSRGAINLRRAARFSHREEGQQGAAFQIEIGGLTTGIAVVESDLVLTVPDAVARFLVDGAPPDIRIEARWCDDRPPAFRRLLFDSGGLWQLYDAGGQFAWTFTSPTFGPTPYKTAVLEPDFSAGTVYLHRPYFDPCSPIYPLEYPLDELVITNYLALGRGVEIHGCGVRDSDGSGYLFLGHSGAGKSTIAARWQAQPNVTVLSDDRIILRKLGDDIWMYGTPWHGDEPLASSSATRLTHGFFLRKARTTRIADVGNAQAIANLFACSFPPFFSAPGLEFTLSLLTEVVRLAPFCELGFVPDDRLPDFVRWITLKE